MQKNKAFIVSLLFAAMPVAAQQLPYQNPQLSPLARARDLCARLTLEEKSQLMRNSSPAIPRLGIPQFEWWSEALHGIARDGYATVFPQNTGMAASWDDALLYRVFCAVADEAVAKNNIARRSGEIKKYQGVSIWTPNVNIFRDPRWGRGMETYGEDPYLTTRMGLAAVNGLQGQDYTNHKKQNYYKTLACAKHFAVHSGPEWNRHVFNIENLPERDLWETYLPAFKSLVRDGHVREVMCAYQRIDGEPCCGNNRYQLALQMARESMVLLQNRNNILPLRGNLKIAVMGPNANDSVTLWGNYNGYPTATTTILQGIRSKDGNVKYISGCGYTRNEISESHYGEIATPDGQKGMRATYWNNTGMKGDPVATATMREPINLSNGGNTVFAPGVNLEDFSAAYEGVFTPKESNTLIVRLASDDKGRVIINGDTVINSWKVRHRVSESAKEYKFEAGKHYNIRVEYAQEKDMAVCQFDILRKAPITAQDIVAKAADADVVVFAGGISPRLEGEEMSVRDPGFRGGDRTSIELPAAQREVVRLLKEAGKKVVFVNCSGGAMALRPEAENSEAILQAWYGGESGGQAVADVLFGDCNPGGKLPVTFYQSDKDLPDFLDYHMTNRTYRYFKGQPLWAFGYGLSYTTFKLGKACVSDSRNGGKTVSVNVKNTGRMAGTEVVQVYIKDPKDINGPTKTLRGYRRVTLQPGESKTLTIDLPRENLELWDASTNTMRVKPGKIQILVGTSSRQQDLQVLGTRL